MNLKKIQKEVFREVYEITGWLSPATRGWKRFAQRGVDVVKELDLPVYSKDLIEKLSELDMSFDMYLSQLPDFRYKDELDGVVDSYIEIDEVASKLDNTLADLDEGLLDIAETYQALAHIQEMPTTLERVIEKNKDNISSNSKELLEEHLQRLMDNKGTLIDIVSRAEDKLSEVEPKSDSFKRMADELLDEISKRPVL